MYLIHDFDKGMFYGPFTDEDRAWLYAAENDFALDENGEPKGWEVRAMYRSDAVASDVNDDNRACITGRLVDFLTYLGTLDDPLSLEMDVPEDGWSQTAAEYVAQAEEHDDPTPEWVNAFNYGRIQ